MFQIMNRLQVWIAWHLPKGVVRWCFFRMTAHASQGQYGNEDVVNMTWNTIADRWEE